MSRDLEALKRLTSGDFKIPRSSIEAAGDLLGGLILWRVGSWFEVRPTTTGYKTKIQRDGKAWAALNGTELAEAIGVHLNTIRNVVKRLIARGLLEKREEGGSYRKKRVMFLRLTGLEKYDELTDHRFEWIRGEDLARGMTLLQAALMGRARWGVDEGRLDVLHTLQGAWYPCRMEPMAIELQTTVVTIQRNLAVMAEKGWVERLARAMLGGRVVSGVRPARALVPHIDRGDGAALGEVDDRYVHFCRMESASYSPTMDVSGLMAFWAEDAGLSHKNVGSVRTFLSDPKTPTRILTLSSSALRPCSPPGYLRYRAEGQKPATVPSGNLPCFCPRGGTSASPLALDASCHTDGAPLRLRSPKPKLGVPTSSSRNDSPGRKGPTPFSSGESGDSPPSNRVGPPFLFSGFSIAGPCIRELPIEERHMLGGPLLAYNDSKVFEAQDDSERKALFPLHEMKTDDEGVPVYPLERAVGDFFGPGGGRLVQALNMGPGLWKQPPSIRKALLPMDRNLLTPATLYSETGEVAEEVIRRVVAYYGFRPEAEDIKAVRSAVACGRLHPAFISALFIARAGGMRGLPLLKELAQYPAAYVRRVRLWFDTEAAAEVCTSLPPEVSASARSSASSQRTGCSRSSLSNSAVNFAPMVADDGSPPRQSAR